MTILKTKSMINPMAMIAKHLPCCNLKVKVHSGIAARCAFTGQQITEGVLLKDIIRKTFTDHAYIRYRSAYASKDAALCIEAVYDTGSRLNSMRNYSYLATEKELRILQRADLLDVLMQPKPLPFVLAVTYSNKKHTAYKCSLNTSNSNFIVTTDVGDVLFDHQDAAAILPVLQSWYCIVPGKEQAEKQPTFFTKEHILHGCSSTKRIMQYGIEKYFAENEVIQGFRNTAFLNLLVHTLNKTTC